MIIDGRTRGLIADLVFLITPVDRTVVSSFPAHDSRTRKISDRLQMPRDYSDGYLVLFLSGVWFDHLPDALCSSYFCGFLITRCDTMRTVVMS